MFFMGVVKVVLPDDLEERLRNFLPSKKGELSKFISEAVREKLDRLEKGVRS